MSDTSGIDRTSEWGARDAEREDPAIAGKPEIPAFGDEAEQGPERPPGRLEEREARQRGVQQHGDTFAVDSEQPTDTSGVPTGSNRVTALPGNEPENEDAA